jgi:hypothetical protein
MNDKKYKEKTCLVLHFNNHNNNNNDDDVMRIVYIKKLK